MNTILLVEDDHTLGDITRRALEKRSFLVSHVTDTAAAQAVLARTHVDYAILDLKLAEETSLSLIPALRAHNKQMKILVLTAYASIATAVDAVKRGADNYLPKPANVSEILAALSVSEVPVDNVFDEKDDGVMSPKRLEWEHIQRVLLKNDGNISATARELNMHRRTLQRKLQKHPVKE